MGLHALAKAPSPTQALKIKMYEFSIMVILVFGKKITRRIQSRSFRFVLSIQGAPKSSEKYPWPLRDSSVPSSSAARWNGRCPANVEAVRLEIRMPRKMRFVRMEAKPM